MQRMVKIENVESENTISKTKSLKDLVKAARGQTSNFVGQKSRQNENAQIFKENIERDLT